jgi:hypothetical protein
LGKINKEKPWKENMRTNTQERKRKKWREEKNDRKKLNCCNTKRCHEQKKAIGNKKNKQ